MARPLPPLNAIRAFEAAARHGSFLAAAAELAVTPGAVSQQVKRLEERLGCALFRRLTRGVVLTEAGAAYRTEVAAALDRLAAATARLGSAAGQDRTLRITALPALAEKWLVPRLPAFQARHPEIEVRLSADAQLVDFVRDPFDLGLRYTDGRHPGLRVERLFGERIFPVCSPALARGLRRPVDLAGLPLLHDQHWTAEWAIWLAAAGVAAPARAQGATFTLYSMALEAAAKGMGVAMGHEALVAEDLAAGRLAAPFRRRVPAPAAYYCVTPPWAEGRPAVEAFRTWLFEAAAPAQRRR